MRRLTGEVDFANDTLSVVGEKSNVDVHRHEVAEARFVLSPTRPEGSSLELVLHDGQEFSVEIDAERGPEIYAQLLDTPSRGEEQEGEV